MVHKLGNIKIIDGKRFKAVNLSYTKTNAKKKAQYLRDHQGSNCRVIKHGKEWYIYRGMR